MPVMETHPKGRRQPVTRGGGVEFAQRQSGFSDGHIALRVDGDPLHRGHVEHQPALTHRVPRDRVAATLDRDW